MNIMTAHHFLTLITDQNPKVATSGEVESLLLQDTLKTSFNCSREARRYENYPSANGFV